MGHHLPPNDLLRQARLRRVSPTGSGRPMSRQELAEQVNDHLYQRTGRLHALDASYVGKLERGQHRWPNDLYREAFRTVLGATCDTDLGFHVIRGWTSGRGGGQWGETPKVPLPPGAGVVDTVIRSHSPLTVDPLAETSVEEAHHTRLFASPGRFFAGTPIDVHTFPIVRSDEAVVVVPPDYASTSFLRRPHRGLILGVADDRRGGFALDARQARRRLVNTRGNRLSIPTERYSEPLIGL